jgi:predicted CoA-binding protein
MWWRKSGNCKYRHRNALDDTVCSILREFKQVAIVGLSDNPWRDSNYVASYMMRGGYTIHPVNPNLVEVFGLQAYPDLRSAPKPIDVVEIFRRPEAITETVNQAIEIGARAIWIEGGFVDDSWAATARRAGLRVVMERCMMVEHDVHLGRRR